MGLKVRGSSAADVTGARGTEEQPPHYDNDALSRNAIMDLIAKHAGKMVEGTAMRGREAMQGLILEYGDGLHQTNQNLSTTIKSRPP